VVAAACGGVENRMGVIGASTQDNADGVLDSVTITRRVLIDVDLDNNVSGYSTILASAAPSDVVCASGAVFAVERAPVGTGLEFSVDTSQDDDTSDPPTFAVEDVVVDC
jgi:hypothetical protein